MGVRRRTKKAMANFGLLIFLVATATASEPSTPMPTRARGVAITGFAFPQRIGETAGQWGSQRTTMVDPLLVVRSPPLGRRRRRTTTPCRPLAVASSSPPRSSSAGRAADPDDGRNRRPRPPPPRRFSDDATYRRNLEIRDLARAASRGDPGAARRAEEILIRMEEEEGDDGGDGGDNESEGESFGSPDTVSYNGVINAYAKSPKVDGAVDAERILERMENAHRRQREAREEWLRANAEGGDDIGDGENDNARIEPQIAVKPNVRTYSTVIDAWSRRPPRHGRSAARAQSVLDRLSSLYDETDDEELKPNRVSYNSAINAWAKSGIGRDGAVRAERLLDDMEREGGIVPDVVSYNAAMHAWARSGEDDAGERAESILRRANSRAETDSATDEGGVEAAKPNARTFATAIDAWTRSSSPSSALRAHQLLIDAERLYASARDESVRPNVVAYSSVINAYARSTLPDKASIAVRLLRKMIELSATGENREATPTLVTYNSVLNACATSHARGGDGETGAATVDFDDGASPHDEKGDDDDCRRSTAMSIVKSIYRELTTNDENLRNPFGLRADHFTYGTVLKACANLIDPKAHLSSSPFGEGTDDDTRHEAPETKFVREVFETCCHEGQASFGVCFQLRQAAPAALYRSLIPTEAFDSDTGRFQYEDMPKEWSRNVAERGEGRKRFGSQSGKDRSE